MASFCPFSQNNDKYSTNLDYKWKKHRWCACDSNPGLHDDRHRHIRWAKAPPNDHTLWHIIIFPSYRSTNTTLWATRWLHTPSRKRIKIIVPFKMRVWQLRLRLQLLCSSELWTLLPLRFIKERESRREYFNLVRVFKKAFHKSNFVCNYCRSLQLYVFN